MPVQQPAVAAPYARFDPTDESKRKLMDPTKSWVDDLDPRVKKLGLVAMLGSSFCFAIMALLVKMLADFSTFELVFWRSLFMTFFGTTMCLRAGLNPLGPGINAAGILILRGVMGFFFMGCFYAAIKDLPLSDAVVITYLSPVLTTIAAFLVLGEQLGMLDVFGSCLSLTGVVLVSKPTFIMGLLGEKVAPLPAVGTCWALGSALSSTSVYILLRFAKNLSPMVATNYFAMCGVVLGPLFGVLFGESFHAPKATDYIWLLLIAVLSVVGQNLMNWGLALESAGKATAMNYSQVVWSYIFQIFILHDSSGSDWQSVVGAAMIASWGGVSVYKDMKMKQKLQANARVAPLLENNES